MNRLTPEQQFLLSAAGDVWEQRRLAKAAGLTFGEETITETLLLAMKMRFPGPIEILAYNKYQEARNGADWLWSFVNANATRSITMLVQAKRLDDNEIRYNGIKRIIGKQQPPVRQIDRLIVTAGNMQIPALYMFYNHLSDRSRIPLSCHSLPPGDPGHISGFGISLAEADPVLAALPDEHFDTHCQHSIPLHCLLCSRGSGRKGSGGSPDAIAAALARFRNRLDGRHRDDADPPPTGLRDGMHPAVSYALEERRRADEDGTTLEPSHDLPGVDGVIVLRDTKDMPPGDG
jgi:hypothetical protein